MYNYIYIYIIIYIYMYIYIYIYTYIFFPYASLLSFSQLYNYRSYNSASRCWVCIKKVHQYSMHAQLFICESVLIAPSDCKYKNIHLSFLRDIHCQNVHYLDLYNGSRLFVNMQIERVCIVVPFSWNNSVCPICRRLGDIHSWNVYDHILDL